LLEKLSRAAGFELHGDPDARPLTLALRDQPLEQVLPALLLDLPYRAQWRVAGVPAEHVLVKLELGEPEAAAQAQAQEPEKKKARADAIREKLRSMREGRLSDEQRAELDARREEKARSQADLLEQLRSSTPDMRIEAVNGIDPEGPALTSLIALLADDPDARVRAAVAEQLGNADGYAAIDALFGALDDPDPTVVLKILDSLQFVCDETCAPVLRSKCLNHPDAKVREACAEAAEFVE
jgi:HEAT repeat protein